MPLGAATVSNDLVFTDLFDGVLIALNRSTGAIVYRHKLPTSANAPIAVFGNTVLVPRWRDFGESEPSPKRGQLVAYTLPVSPAADPFPVNLSERKRSTKLTAAKVLVTSAGDAATSIAAPFCSK